MKIADKYKEKTVLSFEVFPPKPTSPENVIYDALDKLSTLSPDFISVTYGAGSNARCDKTIQIASDIKNKYGIESVAHLPSISLTKEEVSSTLKRLSENNIENILALQGNIFPDTVKSGDFAHASDLIRFIRNNGNFNIMAACYPEGHPECESLDKDIYYMKQKEDAGANGFISQLFFDNDLFYEFLEKAEKEGITSPIEAGIMPVTNTRQIEKMTTMCKVKLPKKFLKAMEKYENNPIALRDAGIAYAADQIVDLLAHDVKGIHLYTMNNSYVAEKIVNSFFRLLTA